MPGLGVGVYGVNADLPLSKGRDGSFNSVKTMEAAQATVAPSPSYAYLILDSNSAFVGVTFLFLEIRDR